MKLEGSRTSLGSVDFAVYVLCSRLLACYKVQPALVPPDPIELCGQLHVCSHIFLVVSCVEDVCWSALQPVLGAPGSEGRAWTQIFLSSFRFCDGLHWLGIFLLSASRRLTPVGGSATAEFAGAKIEQRRPLEAGVVGD